MKKHLTLFVSAIAVLWSCASIAQTAQNSGQRFQDGIYARPTKVDKAAAAVSQSEIADLSARTRGSQVFLKRGAQNDTLFIPENKVATFKWNPNDSTATLSLMDPYDYMRENRFSMGLYPYGCHPYYGFGMSWHSPYWWGPSFSIGWGRPWHTGCFDPWYNSRWGWGGWYDPWYCNSWYSPFFGHSSLYWGSLCYDPWYWGSMAWDPWYWDSWYGPWGMYGMYGMWDWYGPWGMYGPYGIYGPYGHYGYMGIWGYPYHGHYPGHGGHMGHEYQYTPRSKTMSRDIIRGGSYSGSGTPTHSTAMRNGLGSTSSVRRGSTSASRQSVATKAQTPGGSTSTTRRASGTPSAVIAGSQTQSNAGSATVRRSSPAVGTARSVTPTSGASTSSGSYSRSSSSTQSRSTTYERSSSDVFRSSSSSSSSSSMSRSSSGGGFSGGSGGGYSGGGASHSSSGGGHRR